MRAMARVLGVEGVFVCVCVGGGGRVSTERWCLHQHHRCLGYLCRGYLQKDGVYINIIGVSATCV